MGTYPIYDDAAQQQNLPPARPPLVNAGSGEDRTIAQLAERIREAVESRAGIAYGRSKPDGTLQKLLDIGLIRSLGCSRGTPAANGKLLP